MRVPVTCNGVICCSALLDSGNLYRNVCSLNFLQRLGLSRKDIVPLRVDTVGTAEAGSKMRILGETRYTISAQLGDHPTKIHFKPVVVDKLITELIIGAPFMKKHNIDQLHSRGCITFQGKEIPLLPPHITGPISLEDHLPFNSEQRQRKINRRRYQPNPPFHRRSRNLYQHSL